MAENLVEKDLPPPEANEHVFEESAESNIHTTKIHYTWTIRNFKLCFTKVKQEMKSPTFSGGVKDKYNWQLILSTDECYFFLQLCFLPGEKSEAYANCDINILNDIDSVCSEPIWKKSFFTYCKETPLSDAVFLLRGRLYNDTYTVLRNDVLTIFCDIIIIEDIINTVKKPYPEVSEVTACQRLLQDISHLHESPKLCDVTLISCGREIQAHKVILAALSSVFELNNGMRQYENLPVITDIKNDVLKEMLRYVYTGKIINLDKITYRLLAAADKYELKMLKDRCEQALCKSITDENAISRLILGELLNAVHLKEKALDFICAQKQIQRTY